MFIPHRRATNLNTSERAYILHSPHHQPSSLVHDDTHPPTLSSAQEIFALEHFLRRHSPKKETFSPYHRPYDFPSRLGAHFTCPQANMLAQVHISLLVLHEHLRQKKKQREKNPTRKKTNNFSHLISLTKN